MRNLGKMVRRAERRAVAVIVDLSQVLAVASTLVFAMGAILGSYVPEGLRQQIFLPALLTMWVSSGICKYFDQRS